MMVSFYEKIVFPGLINYIYYVQLFLMLAWILSFLLYIITAYERNKYSVVIWGIHVLSPYFIIMHQAAFIPNPESSFSSNLLFCFFQWYFLILILMSDYLAFGKYHAWQLDRRWKIKKIKIGILNDIPWEENEQETRTWTDISPSMWKKGFMGKNMQVGLITNNADFDKYVAVINPYGGVYPEADLKTLTTHNKILNFVRGGGIFVNVADIPTYWAYNAYLKRKIDHTEAIFIQTPDGIMPVKPFTLTPLMKELSLNVLSVDQNPIPQNLDEYAMLHFDFVSRRVAVKIPNMISIIPEREIGQENGKIVTSAMFFILYGEGEFLISLMYINDSLHDIKSRITIRDAIINNLVTKLNQKKEMKEKITKNEPLIRS